MIGHYVNNLTQREEDRVLERPMGMTTHPEYRPEAPGCLLQVARGEWEIGFYDRTCRWKCRLTHEIGNTYDRLLTRFGALRVNHAIRNRILSNRARRALHRPVESSGESLLIAAGSACTGDE